MKTYKVRVGESLPDLGLFVRDNGALLAGLASGYTFALKVGTLDGDLVFTKSSGIVGQTGANSPPLGTPNVVIRWATTDELDQLTPGTFKAQLFITRSSDSKVRIEEWLISVAATL